MKQPLPELLRGKYLLRMNLALEALYQRVSARCNTSLPARNSVLVRRLVPALPKAEDVIDQVGRANIEQLFTAGPEEALKIFDYVPEPWHSVFLASKPKSIESIARLVALNLDWYLEPPRPLLRREWRAVAGAAAASLVLCAAITALLVGTSATALTIISVVVFFTMLNTVWCGAAALYGSGYHRQQVYLDALRHHFRGLVKGAHGPGMPDATGELIPSNAGGLPHQDMAEPVGHTDRRLEVDTDESEP
ncbi:hypothetical protein JW859_09330 [bacterium]|nr:hypothetical protein [bacterium]